MTTLDNIHVVLVGTTHPGNIGAAARAMKTMGLSNLHLVTPDIYPDAEATARAAGGYDILAKASVHDIMGSAIASCHQVYGMSARSRRLPLPIVNLREAASQINQAHDGTNIAILFGSEHSGLSNNELDHCQYLIRIPANPDCTSLNLGAAVQVCAYELKMACESPTTEVRDIVNREFLTMDDMEYLFDRFERSLTAIDLLDSSKPRNLMRRLRRLLNRANLDRNELRILHGILRAVEKMKDRSNE